MSRYMKVACWISWTISLPAAQITPLGRTLQIPFKALYAWTLENIEMVEHARSAFDRRA
jgi:DNA-binding HxlR family transcriptional regulator